MRSRTPLSKYIGRSTPNIHIKGTADHSLYKDEAAAMKRHSAVPLDSSTLSSTLRQRHPQQYPVMNTSSASRGSIKEDYNSKVYRGRKLQE
jgi:hypothetical protein